MARTRKDRKMEKRIIAIKAANTPLMRVFWWIWFSVPAIASLMSMMPAHAGQVVGTITGLIGPMVR